MLCFRMKTEYSGNNLVAAQKLGTENFIIFDNSNQGKVYSIYSYPNVLGVLQQEINSNALQVSDCGNNDYIIGAVSYDALYKVSLQISIYQLPATIKSKFTYSLNSVLGFDGHTFNIFCNSNATGKEISILYEWRDGSSTPPYKFLMAFTDQNGNLIKQNPAVIESLYDIASYKYHWKFSIFQALGFSIPK